jgi:hypothetical protein
LRVGADPTSCWTAAPARQVCTWWLNARHAGWELLAPTVPTKAPVALVCELPIDGTPRAADACSVHRREFVPLEDELARYGAGDVAARARASADSRDERRPEARAVLDAQRTLAALSRLVGSGPDRCEADTPSQQLCTWNVGNRFEGYELLAAAAGTGRRVRLVCTLPTDGSDRAPDSCRTLEL